jgi:hypothetical protein
VSRALLTAVLAAGLAACALDRPRPTIEPANVGDVPRERAGECAQVCAKLGMRLSAVVVMMNSAGCVCEPPAPAPGVPVGATSAAAGGTAIAAAEAAAAEALWYAASSKQPQRRP